MDTSDNPTAEVTPSKKSEPKKTFVLKKWTGVALWHFGDDTNSDCGICRSSKQDYCMDCQANRDGTSSDGCNVAWGVCGHSFHTHCISRWLKARNSCPVDNSEWQYNRFDSSKTKN